MAIEVGSSVFFGRYPQAGGPNPEPEPIEWKVLDMQGSKALMISVYGLDVKPYNETWKNTCWKACTLRDWLKEEFLYDAFSEKDKNGRHT